MLVRSQDKTTLIFNSEIYYIETGYFESCKVIAKISNMKIELATYTSFDKAIKAIDILENHLRGVVPYDSFGFPSDEEVGVTIII